MRRTFTVICCILLVASHLTKAQTCDMYIGGYIPNYRNPAIVDYSKVSHVFYAFARTNTSGALITDKESTVFQTFKSAAAGKQRFLSLAGPAEYSAMTASPLARAAFVTNCVNFCQSNDLQGIDMDWEGINNAADSVKYGALMRELSAALHASSLQLVATISYGNSGGKFYNVNVLKQTTDWIQLMVYDNTGTWSTSPYGNHATYQHMLTAVAYWQGRGFTDLSKIVVGLPFYGRTFTSTAGGLAPGVAYSTILTNNPDLPCEANDVGLTVFNGPELIRDKVQYVINSGLKGVMAWELGQDANAENDRSLLKAISQAACGLPSACPVTTSTLFASDEQDVIFRNPVSETLVLTLQQSTSNYKTLEVIDITGNVIYAKEDAFTEDTEEVNMTSQASGMYIVRLRLSEKKTVVRRFVKI